MNGLKSESGVSPVIAVLLMVAITVILAGVVAVWAVGFLGKENNDGELHIIQTRLDSTRDRVVIDVIAGDVLNSSFMLVLIDGNSFPAPEGEFYAGDQIVVACPLDLLTGEQYDVKVVLDDKVIYEDVEIAVP